MAWKPPEGITVALLAAAFGFIGGAVGDATGYLVKTQEIEATTSVKNREVDVQMLQIALGILREDPSQSRIKAARGWAVDVINESAPIKIPSKAREELVSERLTFIYRTQAEVLGWKPVLDGLKAKGTVIYEALPKGIIPFTQV